MHEFATTCTSVACCRSVESGPKDQVALQWLRYYYTSLLYWCTAARSIEIVQYARTSSWQIDGISRYTIPASAGPLLPLCCRLVRVPSTDARLYGSSWLNAVHLNSGWHVHSTQDALTHTQTILRKTVLPSLYSHSKLTSQLNHSGDHGLIKIIPTCELTIAG